MSPFRPVLTALAASLLLTSLPGHAADTNARDFFTAPVGTSLGVLYLPATWADSFHSASSKDNHARLNVEALAWRQLWFSDVCGTLCTPQFIIPAANIKATLPGSQTSQQDRGIGDPQVGGTLFFINRPDQREYSGLLTLITLPVGSYDARHPDVSSGANRWGATFLYNYTRGVGKNWVLEASLEAQFYGNNDNYLGSSLKQQPLYRLQAFASYDFTSDSYGALRLYHTRGGALRLNGQELSDTRQNSTQLGVELGHWLSKQDQLMLMLARNVHTTNSFDSSQAMLRLVHVF
ncbi:transporter [Aquitalea sp. LB_tupeE]|uniref:transporter n=1 Tax=Aquitalea sp. LB_tupeE TaxID=2748078 RepID=UPI0015BE94E2|nr:transporter [Aquitalea sp. LB_tupeE]NWK79355.1 transporter [Aquitalea sp. LB_tupeE]